MKRFTDTNKWDDPWFSRLDLKHKMLWIYICDHVDHAGVWDPNQTHAEYFIGHKLNWDEVMVIFDSKIRLLNNGRWWLPSFIGFQFGTKLNGDTNLHRSIIALLQKHGLTDDYATWLTEQKTGKAQLTESAMLPLVFGKKPKKEWKPRAQFTPPTLGDVAAYAKERNSAVDPKVFWDYFQNGNPPWTDMKGRAVRSWKQKFITWDNASDKNNVKPVQQFQTPKLLR
jgi:hypothetical protein